MNIQNNQAGSTYRKIAALKPTIFIKNPSVMGVPAPLRAGPAPRMQLDETNLNLNYPEAKISVVDIQGDIDSLKMEENYQDDWFASAEYTAAHHFFSSSKNLRSEKLAQQTLTSSIVMKIPEKKSARVAV